MTAEESTKAVTAIASRKLAILRGQIWQVFDKPYTWNAKIFTGPVLNLFPMVGYDERKKGVHVYLPIHKSEVEAFIKNPFSDDNVTLETIASASLN